MDDWKGFITEKARTAKLATTREDGRAHVAPVWIDVDGDDIVFNTGEGTVKGRNILRDPRVALCVDDETPPFSFLIVEGEATTSDDMDEMLKWATRIGGRYMGADVAEKYGKRNAVPGELLVRVRPTKVILKRNVAS
jgi:PPOX class probable F420-dependent enzyme